MLTAPDTSNFPLVMQLTALSNLLFVDAEFSGDRAKGGANKEAPLVVLRHKHLDIPPCHHGLFFFPTFVFHCLVKEKQHMLKEIRYMSGLK